MEITEQIDIVESSAVSITSWHDGNPGPRFLVTGRLCVTDTALLGTVRLRFSWTDPAAGAQTRDASLLLTLLGYVDFTFPVVLVDSTAISYQVDILSLSGGPYEYSVYADVLDLAN